MMKFANRWIKSVTVLMLMVLWQPMVVAQEFLDVQSAFPVTAMMKGTSTVEVKFLIADGYYLYRDRIKFSSSDAHLGEPLIPAGIKKYDLGLEKEVETFRRIVVVQIPVKANGAFHLKISRQGCADKGLCYPPTENVLVVKPALISAK